jgi:hypothetical protein
MGDPGTQMIIKGAMMAASMAMTASQKIEGPRLDSLDVTTADFGTQLNYFWGKRRMEGCPIFWAEKLREKKTTSKTKGGKYANYKYFGTFAVAICDHEIDAVTRIWMDKHIVYDVTKAGPVSPLLGFFPGLSGAPVKITNGRNMRIYKGTETQEPDPRMESWCEDRYGVDSCPAYRGVSYIVFQDIPLEKFGNRIPQITVEAVKNSSNNYLFETIAPGASLGPIFSYDGTRALFYNTNGSKTFAIWDTATRTKLISGVVPVGDVDAMAYAPDGKIWVLGGTLGDTLSLISPDGLTNLATVDLGTFTEGPVPLGDRVYLRPYAGAGTTIWIATVAGISAIDVSFTPSHYFEDLNGDDWAVGMAGTNIHLYNITASTEQIVASPGGITGGEAGGFVNSDGNFVIFIDNTAVLIDGAAFAVTTSVAMGTAPIGPFRPGDARFFSHTKEFDANTLAELRTYSLASWTSANTSGQSYDPTNHAFWGVTSGSGTRTIRYIDRIGSAVTTLASIIADVSGRCGLVGIELSDLEALTDEDAEKPPPADNDTAPAEGALAA